MKRTFFKRLMVVGFILIFQAPFLSSADDTISPNIVKAAQEGIKTFITGSKITDLYHLDSQVKRKSMQQPLEKGFRFTRFILPAF